MLFYPCCCKCIVCCIQTIKTELAIFACTIEAALRASGKRARYSPIVIYLHNHQPSFLNVRHLDLSSVEPSSVHILSSITTAFQIGKHEIDITIRPSIHKAVKYFSMFLAFCRYIRLGVSERYVIVKHIMIRKLIIKGKWK